MGSTETVQESTSTGAAGHMGTAAISNTKQSHPKNSAYAEETAHQDAYLLSLPSQPPLRAAEYRGKVCTHGPTGFSEAGEAPSSTSQSEVQQHCDIAITTVAPEDLRESSLTESSEPLSMGVAMPRSSTAPLGHAPPSYAREGGASMRMHAGRAVLIHLPVHVNPDLHLLVTLRQRNSTPRNDTPNMHDSFSKHLAT